MICIKKEDGLSFQFFNKKSNQKTIQKDNLLCNIMEEPLKKIYIDSQWYDITQFVKRHPGGSVIESYINQDASMVYKEMHRRSKRANKLLNSLPKLDCDVVPTTRTNPNMLIDFERWRLSLEERGFFKPSPKHAAYRLFELAGIFLLATWCMSFSSWSGRIGGVLLYGLFGGRCGWVQHEAGHRSFTGNIAIDSVIQKVTVGFGVLTCGSMWNSMHNKHHATTQKIEYDMDLDTMPFVLFHEDANSRKRPYNRWWIRMQSWTFLPVTSGIIVMMFWIFYLHPRKIIRDRDTLQAVSTLSGHIGRTWLIQRVTGCTVFQSYMWLMACMYATGIYLFGHFSTSHTFMPVVTATENPSWVEYSLDHTVDISTQNPIVSWVMGYLNCQCVHHLFPQMPQFRQPKVSLELEQFAKKWKMQYHHVGYFEAWYKTFANMDRVGALLSES